VVVVVVVVVVMMMMMVMVELMTKNAERDDTCRNRIFKMWHRLKNCPARTQARERDWG
jgi:hypothetical protein